MEGVAQIPGSLWPFSLSATAASFELPFSSFQDELTDDTALPSDSLVGYNDKVEPGSRKTGIEQLLGIVEDAHAKPAAPEPSGDIALREEDDPFEHSEDKMLCPDCFHLVGVHSRHGCMFVTEQGNFCDCLHPHSDKGNDWSGMRKGRYGQ